MPFILESPNMGPCQAFCFVRINENGFADLTLDRGSATAFRSKSIARRIAASMIIGKFEPVEVLEDVPVWEDSKP